MQRLQWLRLDPTHEGQRSQTRPILDVCGPMWGGVGQEHGVAVVAGKAGVVAGAAPAARTAVPAAPRQGLGGPRAGGQPLGLAKLLDQEPLVSPLLVDQRQTKG